MTLQTETAADQAVTIANLICEMCDLRAKATRDLGALVSFTEIAMTKLTGRGCPVPQELLRDLAEILDKERYRAVKEWLKVQAAGALRL